LLAGANYRNLQWSYDIGANDLTVPNLFTISNVNGSPVTAQDNVWIRSNSVYAQELLDMVISYSLMYCPQRLVVNH
jgi:hypothetical protein